MSSANLVSLLTFAVLFASSFWVLYDAKAIGVQKGQLKGLCDLGPWTWFFACLFLWIIAFPLYLAKRRQLLQINGKESASNTPAKIGFAVFALQVVFLGLLVSGNLKTSTSDLQTQVQANIVESFAKDPRFEGVTVQGLQLVHNAGNSYTGLLQVTSQGQNTQLMVNVTYDGSRFMWQIAP